MNAFLRKLAGLFSRGVPDDPRAFGRWAEGRAICFLEGKGLRLIERNFDAGIAEIDAVMRDGNRVVFVEVKARHEGGHGALAPHQNVTRRKRGQIVKAAKVWMARRKVLDVPTRFDVVSVTATGGKTAIEHIAGAFGEN